MNGKKLVKICGVTREEDALAAVELGADLLGLNFWKGSPRFVELERARAIAGAVRSARGERGALLVGVFVDAPVEAVRETLEAVGLDLAQLHGDEPESDHAALAGRSIRVYRGVPEVARDEGNPPVWGALVDAAAGPRYGGAGASWDYARLAGWRGARPLLVAGGIGPGRAAAALAASGADGVDVASGVESAPGVKDRERMRELIEEIRRAETKNAPGR